jgi:hypothetical protein
MNDYEDLLETMKGFAESLRSLNQQAVTAYAPIVEDILRSRSHDVNHIEHTLDGLISFCGYEPALLLFKKLCRHYWEIDPVATAAHIDAYRHLYDSDDEPADENVAAPQERGDA